MGRRWQLERGRDHFYRMAKRERYRSRAAFKLKQLDERYNLLRRGHVVVDLGAAPGGWLQVARERVGGEGFVLGIDLQAIAELPHENVATLVADITDASTPELIMAKLPRAADVVLSDASPKISGVWDVDQARSVELARSALAIADAILAPGGKLLVKVFQGGMFEELVAEVRRRFSSLKVTKPAASRRGSAEVYVVAKGFRRSR
ncbi:MAG: RlmE family RNA methyltransferase [Candidatus Hodarchaeaceae archaeon]|nr:RlmE family RNA methyltransferase [Candidatus Hodarchaeaceae archaeon]